MSETILLYLFISSFALSLLLDTVLLPAVWRHNPAWAAQRRIPRRVVDGQGLWRWTWSLMIFDANIHVTPAICMLAVLSGVLRHAALVGLLILLSISDLTPRPFAHKKHGGGTRHAMVG
jgi:hypothetical protein